VKIMEKLKWKRIIIGKEEGNFFLYFKCTFSSHVSTACLPPGYLVLGFKDHPEALCLTKDGKLAWRAPISEPSKKLYHSGKGVFSVGEKYVDCLNADEGTLLWSVELGKVVKFEPMSRGLLGGIAVYEKGGKKYIGKINNGKVEWKTELEILPESIHVSLDSNSFVCHEGPTAANFSDSGEEIWNIELKSNIRDFCVSKGGTAFAALTDKVEFIGMAGTVKWRYPEDNRVPKGLVMSDDGLVIYAIFDDELHRVSNIGKMLWKMPIKKFDRYELVGNSRSVALMGENGVIVIDRYGNIAGHLPTLTSEKIYYSPIGQMVSVSEKEDMGNISVHDISLSLIMSALKESRALKNWMDAKGQSSEFGEKYFRHAVSALNRGELDNALECAVMSLKYHEETLASIQEPIGDKAKNIENVMIPVDYTYHTLPKDRPYAKTYCKCGVLIYIYEREQKIVECERCGRKGKIKEVKDTDVREYESMEEDKIETKN